MLAGNKIMEEKLKQLLLDCYEYFFEFMDEDGYQPLRERELGERLNEAMNALEEQ